MNAILTILHETIGQLFLLPSRNRKVQRQINRLERCKPPPNYVNPDYPLFALDALLRHLQQEQARRQIIEDKAKTNILGITLAFTVILASVAFAPRIAAIAKNNADWAVWAFMAFMAFQLCGILFLLAGGWLALSTLRVAKNYIWTLHDERVNTTNEARNAEISWYLQNNQLVSTLKANLLDASYSCIRNGVAAVAISAMLALILLLRGF